MRDLIAAHGGYEINTEGDAFHVAFKDVARAVHFCMEVQYQMMELEWPKEVLRLPECREVRSPDGGLSYRGPRVRMGVHWATEGSVVQSIHALTKHKIFSGPAFQVTRELCESAVGGQVLLTHDVWQRLRAEMPAASFPVVEQLGCYKFSSWTESIWVYQVTRLLGRPLHRPPIPNPKLAGADAIVPGAGLSIMPVPVPRTSRGDLAFVSCRFAVEDCPASASGAPLPAAVQSRLFEGLAAAAMQFEGYIFRMSESQGCYLLAFASPIDAVRFCHAAQVLLMYIPWTPEMAEWCGAEEGGPDGKLVFNGPRVAMAVHESNDYSTRPVPMAVPTADGAATLTDYLGPAEEAVRALSEVAHGGQVVLSEAAWRAVQDQLPGSPQVISLGSHILEETCFTGPAMLMEVMPQPLSKRSFPPPRRARMVDPGYRDAPSARFDVAIAQMRVVKPAVVAAAESAANNLSDDAIIRVVTAYNVALARAVRAARTLLRAHNGYECKEPEPGKLTVAFTSLEAAVRWGAHLQRALLDIHWPKEVLSWDECREVRDGEGEGDGDDLDLDLVYGEDFKEGLVSIGGVVTTFQPHKAASSAGASGRGGILGGIDGAGGEVASVTASGFGESSLLWRGLRVRIGIACGVPTSKAPLNTGRADYFGTIPNLAARLMSIAQPGQVIFDAAKLPTLKSLQWRDDTGVMPGNEAFAEGLEVTALGQFAIKGLEELRSVFQALPVGLQGRAFEESPALVRPVGLSLSRRIASLRRPSEPLAAGIVGVPPAEGPLAAGANGAGPTAPGAGSTPSASAFASPKAWRPGGIFSSISRSGSATLGNRRGPAGSATALLARSVSRLSDSSDGTGALRPPVVLRASALSASETSTNSWLARSMAAAGTRIGVRSGPGRDSFGDPAQDSSAASSPKSPSATSFSGIPIPTGNALGGAKARGSRLSNADLDPEGGGASSAPAGTGFVGPEMSPEGGSLAAAASMAPSGPYTTLGDVADWSYPASRSHTPCAVSKVVDHWDAGLAMEAALKSDGLDLAQQRRRDMDAQVESSSPAGSLMLEAAERGQEGSQGDWRHPKRGLKVQTQSAERGVGEGDGSGGHGASTGLQYARQIAQLFVDRKRKSLERSTAGKETVPGASPTKSSWLSGRLRPSGSKEATPGTTPTKGLLGGLKGRRGAFSDQVDP